MLREVAAASGRRIVFFCAFGERSAMAGAAAKEAGLANTAHIAGGLDAWKKAGGPGQTGGESTFSPLPGLTRPSTSFLLLGSPNGDARPDARHAGCLAR